MWNFELPRLAQAETSDLDAGPISTLEVDVRRTAFVFRRPWGEEKSR